MSFPGIIYGSYGDEMVSQSTKIGTLPLGQRMVLPDGRQYVHAKAGGTALIRGNLTMATDTIDNNDTDQDVATAAAVGDTQVTITLGDAAVTLDYYEDGYAVVNADTANGEIYRIKSNLSAAASSSCVLTFEEGIVTAFGATTTKLGLKKNSFDSVVIWKGGTVVGMPTGIPPTVITADQYFWLQRRGAAGCFVDGAHVLGVGVVPSTEGIDGGLDVQLAASAAATTWETESIGYTMTAQASTEYGMCYLTLD